MTANDLQAEIITLGATEHGPKWDHNTHRVILCMELSDRFIGWPDPADPRNSDQHKPGIDTPMHYPKFAWEKREMTT